MTETDRANARQAPDLALAGNDVDLTAQNTLEFKAEF